MSLSEHFNMAKAIHNASLLSDSVLLLLRLFKKITVEIVERINRLDIYFIVRR